MKLNIKRKVSALTLTEMLVVLVIVGILVLLALPNLMPLISKAKSTEAKVQLEHLFTMQKSYFYEHSKYTNNLEEVGFVQEKLSTDGEGGKANFRITITEASSNSFRAKATAVVDFDGDGTLNEWEVDQEKNIKETIKD